MIAERLPKLSTGQVAVPRKPSVNVKKSGSLWVHGLAMSYTKKPINNGPSISVLEGRCWGYVLTGYLVNLASDLTDHERCRG